MEKVLWMLGLNITQMKFLKFTFEYNAFPIKIPIAFLIEEHKYKNCQNNCQNMLL